MRRRALVAVGALVLGLVRIEDARACSCVGPVDALLSPTGDDAPLGAVVRLVLPATYSHSPAAVLLREAGGGKVDVSLRSWPDGQLTAVELKPTSLFKPSTQYEVAVVDPKAYPSTTVFGTFKTGAAEDRTPPKFAGVGKAVVKSNTGGGGGTCSIPGRWIEIGPVHAEDSGRPKAKLTFAVWAADATGNVDTTKPPRSLVDAYEGTITLGRRSLCDPHDFPIPSVPLLDLAIAAVDESGNASPARKLRVDLRSTAPP